MGIIQISFVENKEGNNEKTVFYRSDYRDRDVQRWRQYNDVGLQYLRNIRERLGTFLINPQSVVKVFYRYRKLL